MKAFIMLLLAVAMTGWLGVPDGNAQPTLYIAVSEKLIDPGFCQPVQNCWSPGASSLHRVNPQTGLATLVGAIGFDVVGEMAFHPLTGVLYAVGQRPSDGAPVLITIDPATGAGAEIAPFTVFGVCEPCLGVVGLAFRPNGVLYGAADGRLFTVNLGTGAVTLIGGTTASYLTFSADGRLFGSVPFEDQFAVFNPVTGEFVQAAIIAAVGALQIFGLDTHPGTGQLWAVMDQGPTVPFLVTIEPAIDPVSNTIPATRGQFILDASGFSGQIGFVLALAWSPGAANTPAGANVVVQVAPATLTFESVTQAGTTTVTTSATGPPPPSGFRLGTPLTYFEVSTTALFDGFVDVCIQYTGIVFGNEASLRLLHFDGAVLADVTTSLNTVNNVICGRSATLSPFVVVERAQSVADMIVDLIESIRGRALPAAFEARLVAALESALVDPRQVSVTCGALQRFIGLVRFAQAIRLIPASRATQWIDDTAAIRAALGC